MSVKLVISLPEDALAPASSLTRENPTIRTLIIVTALTTLSCFHAPSCAQSYPVKPVRYVVAFAAGDSPDIVARLVADRLSRMWDQQMVVENRVGAGGTIAAAMVAKAPADGYTLFHCNIASSAIAPALYSKLPYDALSDFAMVSRIATTANALLVHPSLPAKSVAEFVAQAKANPGRISYGSPGVGTSSHLSMSWWAFRPEEILISWRVQLRGVSLNRGDSRSLWTIGLAPAVTSPPKSWPKRRRTAIPCCLLYSRMQ